MKVNAKQVVFTAIALATVYVLWNNERFVVQPDHPAWTHFAPFKWVLLPHAIFGSIVLLSAPFQFSDRLRARFPKAHRIMGRLYILGVYVLAPTGAYIQYFQERMGAPRSFTILAIVSNASSECTGNGPRAVTQLRWCSSSLEFSSALLVRERWELRWSRL
jgi:hypothetical protein